MIGGVFIQEEATEKSISFVVSGSKLSANLLREVMRAYLNRNRQKVKRKHGKTSVRELIGEGAGVSSIEITDNNIKSFERVARKYNVDFALKKDKTSDPPKYLVFFKSKDADALTQAFKEFVYGNEHKKEKPSVRKKLQQLVEKLSLVANREKVLEKTKNREQSL